MRPISDLYRRTMIASAMAEANGHPRTSQALAALAARLIDPSPGDADDGDDRVGVDRLVSRQNTGQARQNRNGQTLH